MYDSGRTNTSTLFVARPHCYVVNELLYKKYILFKPTPNTETRRENIMTVNVVCHLVLTAKIQLL